ncbi:hypothetical protein D0864_03208 [Hortaea werneckii]|uniref:Metallo-beta-lactamase domain-containing protein n=1 Tax=Hortaea werneckii TaxID=91943 RepID=A0A3M7GMW9_HORWE|nr:hypothetical protein D0864_03208 [Hortaea werneckii]
MHILNLGTLQVDEGWLLQGAGTGSKSSPNPPNQHRDLVLAAGLIDNPDLGLILFETGCAEDVDISWGAPFTDLFPRTVYTEDMKLPNAIKAAGYDIKDVKVVVMGHLHLDHAGGLEHFIGTEVPIYVHEEEFKYACWAVGTGADSGVYLGDYMNLTQLKWKTFTGARFDLCQGITLHHAPGHTPGLCIMQVNLEKEGTFIWTTDQYHVAENHHMSHPQGWLQRDQPAWIRSHHMVLQLERLFGARLIFGHDKETVDRLMREKEFYE